MSSSECQEDILGSKCRYLGVSCHINTATAPTMTRKSVMLTTSLLCPWNGHALVSDGMISTQQLRNRLRYVLFLNSSFRHWPVWDLIRTQCWNFCNDVWKIQFRENKAVPHSSWAKFQVPCQLCRRIPKSSRSQSWDFNGPKKREKAFPTIPCSNPMLIPLFLSHSALFPGWFLREGTTSTQRSTCGLILSGCGGGGVSSVQACLRDAGLFLVPPPSPPLLPGLLRQHRDFLDHWTIKRRCLGGRSQV